MVFETTSLPVGVVVTYGDCWEGKPLLIFHCHTDGGGVVIIFDEVADVQNDEKNKGCDANYEPQYPEKIPRFQKPLFLD